ncbi:MAG: hypothetical protein HDS66_05895, partial [Bacteroidales bacterium]|nr:hypothetical protein [Bacteroidales bacterium]
MDSGRDAQEFIGMIYRAQVPAGGEASGGAPDVGVDVGMNGSKRYLTMISDDTGAIYKVGVQEIVDGYVGRPYKWFDNRGPRSGELFVTYPSVGTYSPPFHGVGDLQGADAIPAQEGGRMFEIAGYPSSYEEAFEYDWDSVTFGGSNIYDMMISDLRNGFPKVMVGDSARRRFVLAGDPEVWKSWYIDVWLHFPFITRDDPYFDLLAYTDGIIDYYKPYVLDSLDSQDSFEVQLSMTRAGKFTPSEAAIDRRGFGYGVTNGDEYYKRYVSGFVNLGKPDVRFFVLPDGRVTLASNS